MKKYRVLTLIILVCIVSMGCSPNPRTKQEIPETEYEEAGYSVKGKVEDDGTVVLTYALLGVKEDKIKYLYLDQIENNPQVDRHLSTNKEMEIAYGLSYKSDHGEWHEQIKALEDYIAGNEMTIEEVNAIPTCKKDENNLMVPEKGSDLEAGCELDISDFLDVINDAYNHLEKTDTNRLGVGEDIRVNNNKGKIDVALSFIGTDYRYKVCFVGLEAYSIENIPGIEVVSQSEKAESDEQLKNWNEGLSAFEEYIDGLNITEAYSVETYDPGNGVELALPKPGTDLADSCEIDLDKFILALQETSARLK